MNKRKKKHKKHDWLRDLRENKAALVSVIVLGIIVFFAVFAPLLTTQDPNYTNLRVRLLPPVPFEGSNPEHLLGTDSVGRDVASRLIYGARISLMVGFIAVVISGLIGVALGLITGYFGGWVDDVIMRLADIQLAFPFILLMLAVLAVVGPGLWNVILVLGVTGWVAYSRIVRGCVMSLREKEFVEAARAIGASNQRIIIKHLIPNIIGPVVVIASFSVSRTIIAEASLSFLGLGVDVETATWGKMLSEGRLYISDAWWLTTLPGICLALTVLCINVFGDWLRDVVDPKSVER